MNFVLFLFSINWTCLIIYYTCVKGHLAPPSSVDAITYIFKLYQYLNPTVLSRDFFEVALYLFHLAVFTVVLVCQCCHHFFSKRVISVNTCDIAPHYGYLLIVYHGYILWSFLTCSCMRSWAQKLMKIWNLLPNRRYIILFFCLIYHPCRWYTTCFFVFTFC